MIRRHIGMRHYGTIYAYITREFILSFVVSFFFFFFIFFVNNILLLAEEVLSKNVPPLDVMKLIFFSLPSVLSISFPFAALVGALMAVGRLSSDNEVLAFQASGVHTSRILIPLLALSVALTGLSFLVNDYFIPVGNINFGKLYTQVFFANPGLELESYSIKRYQDAVIVTGAVEGNQISDIVIFDKDPEKDKRVISAGRATLSHETDQRGVISLQLEDVFTHTSDQSKRDDFDYSLSSIMTYNILLRDISFSVRNPGPREMSSVDVWKVVKEKRAEYAAKVADHEEKIRRAGYKLTQAYRLASAIEGGGSRQLDQDLEKLRGEIAGLRERSIVDRSLQNYEIEFYKKFSLPVACLVFILFAFPVGLLTKRSGRAVGFGVGLFVSILYWGMLFAGQQFGYRMNISPAVATWFPNIVILFAGAGMFLVRKRT